VSLLTKLRRRGYTAPLVAPIVALKDGYRLAFLIGAAFAAAGAIIAFRFIAQGLGPASAAQAGESAASAVPRAEGAPARGAPAPVSAALQLGQAEPPPPPGRRSER
jgi:hypothetical protein